MTSAQDNSGRLASLTAMVAAIVLMAHQVGAKAARDAIFLSYYTPADLPAMVAGAAGAAILLGVAASRVLSRYAPSRAVPWAFGASAALQLGEWRLLAVRPHFAAVLIYLHFIAFSAVLLSGFWSVTNETIDPHTAKRRFGQIAAAGTLGGLGGGLVVASLRTGSVLLWLAALHILGAIAITAMRRVSRVPPPQRPPAAAQKASARRAFTEAPYLFSLAALVLIGTSSAAAIDWVFKAQAAEAFSDRQQLLHFFGLYHSGIQVLGLVLQTFAVRFLLERAGLGKTVATLPATVTAGSVSALFFPVFPVIVGLRASESVVRSSLFRSGYELFYTPIPVSEKRPAKSIIDVGLDRLGDALGAGITKTFLWLGTAAADRILLTAAALSAVGVWVARRLDRGYVQALEKSLVDHAGELDLAPATDSTTRLAILHTSGEAPAIPPPLRPQLPAPAAASPAAALSPAFTPAREQRPPARPLDPLVQRMADLRSGRAGRVRAALRLPDALHPLLVAQAINLLAWDEVSDAAREALTNCAPRICGQLVDALLDETQDFAIRRRIPRVLSAYPTQRSADGLVAALADSRFEVRFQCGRALATVLQAGAELKVDSAAIFAAVGRELSVSRSVWDGHRLLDRRDPSEQTQFLDEVLRERANASLEHVFTLLALVLPREPLMVAFRALHTDAPQLRGLALEYLDTVLPDFVREKLRKIVEHEPAEPKRTGEEIVASLLQSNQSVIIMLRERLARPPD